MNDIIPNMSIAALRTRYFDAIHEAAKDSKSWPFEEARKVAKRIDGRRPAVFQTGYGPSGLPHIGTFAEVARTSMVREAYRQANYDAPSRLIVFSDDMDAMRKVPDNVPNQAMLAEYIGVSLSRVPDPYGEFESFADHNNAMLCDFLDRFGFDYEFVSATDMYTSGAFNEKLKLFGANHDLIKNIILPTLGADRRATYSPFMPIHGPEGTEWTKPYFVQSEGVEWVDGEGEFSAMTDYGQAEGIYLDGGAKLQWKADWALRWMALGVDYEMAGKDLTDSVTLSSKIVRALGGEPPVTMIYELFLDAEGKKISKSLGNGLTIEDWLRYGSQESLRAYLFPNPRRGRNLSPSVVARAEDDYREAYRRYENQTNVERLSNPVHFIDREELAVPTDTVTYSLLLNIAATIVPQTSHDLWTYVTGSLDDLDPDVEEDARALVRHVHAYYWDVMSESIHPRPASDTERAAFAALADRIEALPADANEEAIQYEVYEVGKTFGYDPLRDWFKALYEVLLGQSSGPRFGAYSALLGRERTLSILRTV